jgi:PKD repeat protein
MACPFVSGLCALMRSYDPNISVDRVEQCIKSNADDIDGINPGFVGQLGAGRVNVYQTMLCVPSEPLAVFTTNFVGTACANTPIQFTDQSGGIAPLTWQWSFPGGTPSSATIQNPIVTYPSNGTYTATLIVTNNLGDDTISQTIVIAPPTAVFGNDTTIIAGYPAQPTIYLTGTPPWNIIVSNGAGNTPYNNITENPFVLNTFPQQPTTYTITSIQDDNCNGTPGDNMLVNVIGGEDDPNSPAYLVKHVLLGGGCLAVSNVQYTGDPLALGEFTQAPNLDIGFAGGIVMATGYTTIVNGPNNNGSDTEPPRLV